MFELMDGYSETAVIKVLGIGGGGGNAVAHMVRTGIEGVDFIRSISRSEQSQITVTFVLSRKADAATSDVRDRVSRVRGELPQEIDEPVISKVEANATPIIYLAFSSDRHSPLEVSDIADRLVKDGYLLAPDEAQVMRRMEQQWDVAMK